MKAQTRNRMQRRAQRHISEPQQSTHHASSNDGESNENTIALGAIMGGRGRGYVGRTGTILPKAGEE